MIELLINHKAEVDIKTVKGLGDDNKYANKTAKDIAKLRYHKECVKIIKYYKIKKGGKKVFHFVKWTVKIILKL